MILRLWPLLFFWSGVFTASASSSRQLINVQLLNETASLFGVAFYNEFCFVVWRLPLSQPGLTEGPQLRFSAYEHLLLLLLSLSHILSLSFLPSRSVFFTQGSLNAVVCSVSAHCSYRNAVWCSLHTSESSAEVSFSIALQATLLHT